MKKFTNEEIIKALECCCSKTTALTCRDCPAFIEDDKNKCREMAKAALEIIKEKQAELEEINEKFNCQQTVYSDLSKIIKEQSEKLKTAKLDAIKEFADRLKERLKGDGGLYCETTMNTQIDSLVKELVGDNNA